LNSAGNATVVSQKFGAWNQTDNGGRPVITNITFSEPLKPEIIGSTCSAFAVATGMPCNRTLCPDATNSCPGSGIVLGGPS